MTDNNKPQADNEKSWMASNRFVVLFVVLMVFIASMPTVNLWIDPEDTVWSRMIFSFLFTAILVYVITVVTKVKAVKLTAIVLATPTIGFQFINVITPNAAFQLTSHAFAIFFWR